MWMSTPPAISGDYTASTERNPETLRHWSGRQWSAPWWSDDSPGHVDRARATPARTEGTPVEWVNHASR